MDVSSLFGAQSRLIRMRRLQPSFTTFTPLEKKCLINEIEFQGLSEKRLQSELDHLTQTIFKYKNSSISGEEGGFIAAAVKRNNTALDRV